MLVTGRVFGSRSLFSYIIFFTVALIIPRAIASETTRRNATRRAGVFSALSSRERIYLERRAACDKRRARGLALFVFMNIQALW